MRYIKIYQKVPTLLYNGIKKIVVIWHLKINEIWQYDTL